MSFVCVTCVSIFMTLQRKTSHKLTSRWSENKSWALFSLVTVTVLRDLFETETLSANVQQVSSSAHDRELVLTAFQKQGTEQNDQCLCLKYIILLN